MKNTVKTFTAYGLIFAAILASACNTIEGIGQDAESAGDKAEEITKN